MLKVVFPTSQDIYIEVNGQKLAVVESYKAQSSQSTRYIEAFGQSEPVGTVSGRIKHILNLSRVYMYYDGNSCLDINFFNLHNFNVVIVKPDRRIIYSGCEWANIKESASLNDTVLEDVEIIAAKRMEILQ